MSNHNLMQAEVVGSTKKLLRQRINEALGLLDKGMKAKFKKPTFDADNKRLISDDGTVALQWQLRRDPAQPISFNNQQTSRGIVVVVTLKQQVA